MNTASHPKNALLQQLSDILPQDAILTTKEDLHPYECDGMTAYKRLPLAVVLPTTIEQVQLIVKTCSRLKVPVVARGAGTGLSGGALPHEDGIVLSLARFTQILDIDTANLHARVQPGVRNLAISQAVDHLGLFYAPDPSSQIACSIGGNVAENSGGVHCLKYGLTVHNILEIKVVTIDGELLTIGNDRQDTPGYDLLALMTGSEGMLGIVVEVLVKLTVKPETVQVLMAAFEAVNDAGDAVAAIISKGIIPAGLEMMDNPAIRAAEDFIHAGYPVDAGAILLCELDGTEDEVGEQAARVSAILKHYRASSIHVAKTASRAGKTVGRAQSCLPRRGAHFPRLLLHGWHDPAQTPCARAAKNCRFLPTLRLRCRQCVPCR